MSMDSRILQKPISEEGEGSDAGELDEVSPPPLPSQFEDSHSVPFFSYKNSNPTEAQISTRSTTKACKIILGLTTIL